MGAQTGQQLVEGRGHRRGIPFHPEFDVAAKNRVVHAGQTEHLDGMLPHDLLHQRRERGLHGAHDHHRPLQPATSAVQMGVGLVEHRFDHGPGHHRKPGQKMHRAPARTIAGKAWNPVVRIGDDPGTHREHAHVEAVHVIGALRVVHLSALLSQIAHALLDEHLRLRMQGFYYPI